MSAIRVHEAEAFDSKLSRNFWYDDFLGSVLRDEWGSSGGTLAVVDGQTGGICRHTTAAVNPSSIDMHWNNIRPFLASKRAQFETRTKLDSIVAGSTVCGLEYDSNNWILFYWASAVGANWRIYTLEGGVATFLDSGIAADTNYHVYRIECHTHGATHVHFYIDDVETGNSPITTNIPALYLQPYYDRWTVEAVAKNLDIDYCVVRQDR